MQADAALTRFIHDPVPVPWMLAPSRLLQSCTGEVADEYADIRHSHVSGMLILMLKLADDTVVVCAMHGQVNVHSASATEVKCPKAFSMSVPTGPWTKIERDHNLRLGSIRVVMTVMAVPSTSTASQQPH